MTTTKVRTRSKFRAAALVILTALVAGVVVYASDRPEKSYERPQPLAPEEELAQLAHLGSDGSAMRVPVALPTADPAISEKDLEAFDVFRFVPPGYAGTLTYIDEGEAVVTGAPSADPAEVSRSPLYLDIGELLPPGFSPVELDTFDGGLSSCVRQVFSKPLQAGSISASFEFMRAAKAVRPIDLFVPAGPSASLSLATTSRRGTPVVIFEPSSVGTEAGVDTVQVLWYQAGTLNSVLAHGLSGASVLVVVDGIIAELGG